MTITKNKTRFAALALALLAAAGIIFSATTYASAFTSADPYAEAEYETVQAPVETDMADFVKDLTMLTESEKRQLIDENIAAQPYYDRLNVLEDRIFTVTNDILAGAEHLFDERGRIYSKHDALWEKLWSNLNERQKELDDYSAIIKASDVLTDKEKDVLLDAQARLDELEAEIDVFYAKAEKAAEKLTAARDRTIDELQALYAASAHIWAKIYG